MRSRVGGFEIDNQGTKWLPMLMKESSWQQYVKTYVRSKFIVFDPSQLQTKVFEEYAALDIAHVERADIVLGYIEDENPSGVGMAVEMGIARGMGKMVILVNVCKPDADNPSYRYKRFLEKAATITFTDLGKAVEFINKLQY